MPLTVDEILAHERALEKEIAEKQALLSAYQLLRAQTAGGGSLQPADEVLSAAVTPAPVPPASPESPAGAWRIHPDLQTISRGGGNNGDFVWWPSSKWPKTIPCTMWREF